MIADLILCLALGVALWFANGAKRSWPSSPKGWTRSAFAAVRSSAAYQILALLVVLACLGMSVTIREYGFHVVWLALNGNASVGELDQCYRRQREVSEDVPNIRAAVTGEGCPSEGALSVNDDGRVECALHGVAPPRYRVPRAEPMP